MKSFKLQFYNVFFVKAYLRQLFVDLPFFFHSAKTVSCLSQLIKKLNSTSEVPFFDIFASPR